MSTVAAINRRRRRQLAADRAPVDYQKSLDAAELRDARRAAAQELQSGGSAWFVAAFVLLLVVGSLGAVWVWNEFGPRQWGPQVSVAEAEGRQENPWVFLDLELAPAKPNGAPEPLGRVEVELFAATVPRTAENFRQLCTGAQGFGFKGSPVHRVQPRFVIQGGDITLGNGRGGKSIYGATFEDENFLLRHSQRYLLSMANRGPDTNQSQFFFTLARLPSLNGKHVVFGQVVAGHDVVDEIEARGPPVAKRLRVVDAGQLGYILERSARED